MFYYLSNPLMFHNGKSQMRDLHVDQVAAVHNQHTHLMQPCEELLYHHQLLYLQISPVHYNMTKRLHYSITDWNSDVYEYNREMYNLWSYLFLGAASVFGCVSMDSKGALGTKSATTSRMQRTCPFTAAKWRAVLPLR